MMPDADAVLEVVVQFWKRYGYGPSVRDIALACGFSAGTARNRLRELERDGRIESEPGKARTARPKTASPPGVNRAGRVEVQSATEAALDRQQRD